VSLFFIISGFVILMTLDRTDGIADFAVSRLARLYPVFWVCVASTFLIVHWMNLPGRQTTPWEALVNGTMLPSVFGFPPVDPVYWTLSVELFFYIIVATIFAVGLRRFLIPILYLLLLAGVADHYWPLSQLLTHGGYRIEHMLILGFWPLFLFGITIYEMRKGWRWWYALTLALCGLASSVNGWLVGLTCCGLAAAVFAATQGNISLLSNPLILYLGTISYSFYLIHCNVGYCVIRTFLHWSYSPYVAGLAASVVTIALASVLCFTVERPSNRFIRSKYKMWKLRGIPRAK
jgi:peptidoglycan/LPS O-acetylase OafA/YrhL